MKKISLTLFTFILSVLISFSQDIITKKNGEDIQSKILEVGQTEVKYKKFDNIDGPVFTILKAEILIIRYSNGTKDIFNDTKQVVSDPKPVDETKPIVNETKPVVSDTKQILNEPQIVSNGTRTLDDICNQGIFDAKTNYIAANSGVGATFWTTYLLTPIIGIIPAMACSEKPPLDENLNFKDFQLMKNNDYKQCYVKQAHIIKRKAIWKSYAWGTVTFGVSIFSLLLMIENSY